MGKVQHTVTGCVPVDRSALEAYLALITTNRNVTNAEEARVEAEAARVLAENARVEAEDSRVEVESARVEAEAARVLAENARVEAETARETQAGADHTRAEGDHEVAVEDHTQAGEDHAASSAATNRANEAAAAAEHMVDIKRGPKGDQGNTGSSVDYPYELVNNVTTDDPTKGLSAAQGVVLDEKIAECNKNVFDNSTVLSFEELTATEIVEGKMVGANGSIYSEDSFSVYKYLVAGGEFYAFSGRRYAVSAAVYFVFWYDSNGNYISKEPFRNEVNTSVTFTKQRIVAPANASFAYLNVQNTFAASYYAFYSASVVPVQEASDKLNELVVDTLDSDDAKKALSARQGKVINDKIIGFNKADIPISSGYKIALENIDLSDELLPVRSYYIYSDGKYGTNSEYKHLCVDVSECDFIYVKAGSDYSRICFVTNADCPTSGGDIPLVSGTEPKDLLAGTDYLLPIPSGAVCALILLGQDMQRLPDSVKIYKQVYNTSNRKLTLIQSFGYLGPTSSAATGTLTGNSDWVLAKFICFPVKKGLTYSIKCSALGGTDCRKAMLPSIPYIGCPFTEGGAMSQGLDGVYTGNKGGYNFVASSDGYFFINAFFNDTEVWEINEASVPEGWDKTLRDEVEAQKAGLSFENIDIPSFVRRSCVLSTLGSWRLSGGQHIIIPVSFGQYVRIKTNAEYGTRIGFVKTDTAAEVGVFPDYSDESEFYSRLIGADALAEYMVPRDANYLVVNMRGSSSTYDYTPEYIAIATAAFVKPAMQSDVDYIKFDARRANEISSRSAAIGLTAFPLDRELEDGWEVPQSLQELNFVKKIKQLANIKWTPKSDVPGNHYTRVAGTEYTGIPYSNNTTLAKWVGLTVSLHTFMTSINNPYSLMYTEKANKTNGRSAWGFVYHNGNAYSYYGLACNSFVSAIYGSKSFFSNTRMKTESLRSQKFVAVCKPTTIDFNNIKIGDLINNGSHCLVVMGIRWFSDGRLRVVRVAEEFPYTGYDCPKITDRSEANMISFMANSGEGQPGEPAELGAYPKIISRFAELFDNTEYTPSPYVPLTEYGETEEVVTYNDDICTFAGDKATFGDGELVVINYNLSESPSHTWTAIEVYKDETLLQTYMLSSIDQSELPEGQRNHALKLGTELAAGKYKARLTDGSNYSDYTYWEVLKASPTITKRSDGSYDVYEVSTFGDVVIGKMDTENNDTYFNTVHRHYLTYEEAATHHAIIYPKEETEDYGGTAPESPYVRLLLLGEYGAALSAAYRLVE